MTEHEPPSYSQRISLRWKDNDIYGHVNNVEYYSFFDTVINEFLVNVGGLDIQSGERIGLCAESHCSFMAPLAFPGAVLATLKAEHLGSSSVRYAIRLMNDQDGTLVAEGWFVHVFVDRDTRKPAGIPDSVRTALESIA